jgi:hypothetical protein
MGIEGGHFQIRAGFTESFFSCQAIYPALTGTEFAICQHLPEYLSPLLQLPASVQTDISRFEMEAIHIIKLWNLL